MREQEHSIQVACVNWFRYRYPNHLIYSIPNGGKRNAIVAAKLKAEGVLAGVPDLFVPVARNGWHGLYIEMKAGKNKPTEAQNNVMATLSGQGYKCEVCRSLEEFTMVVEAYFDERKNIKGYYGC